MDAAALLGAPELAGDLLRLEDMLRSSTSAMDPFLSQVAGHLVAAGGKRIRPALTLAAALAGGAAVDDDLIMGGISVELVHIGSLYHDDVMDEAESRRGVQSVNARWGNLVAILAGDFLLARASEIAASLGTEVAGLLAATIGRLCEGQVGELRTAFDPGRSEAAYFESIAGKTASLTAAACRIGGVVAGLPRPAVDALTAFGEAFGIVFQIRDDCLDVTGTDEQLGKPAGQDLVEGTYSLPVIRALAMPDVGDELRPLLGRPLDGPERDKAREIIQASGAVQQALATAQEYALTASAALSPLDSTPVATALAGAGQRLLAS
ncbi:MAG: polyprenyl synthetase family protein [Actinobacteria bacterium]|nr:polyprenyl synthetase family protein [Actinomycetota bacterium]MBW3651572.1 polyprenyl synthetase family protein [Actinomycetota bacterium]